MARTKKTKTKSAKDSAKTEGETFEVEKILDKRGTAKSLQYYVKWKGYPNTDNTWEPAENIFSSDLIQEYEAQKSQAKPQTPKGGRQALVGSPISRNLKFSPSPDGTSDKIEDMEDDAIVTKPSPAKRARSTKQAPKVAKKAPTKAKEESPVKVKSTIEKGADITTTDLKKFKYEKVINESLNSKTITCKGSYNGETAVVVLEKTNFDEADLSKMLLDEATSLTVDFVNDKYSSYKVSPGNSSDGVNILKAVFVCPANEAVLSKYSRSDAIFFTETADLYQKVVEPFINNKLNKQKDYNTWIYNILDGKSEAERVILDDKNLETGFILTPSLKWSGDEKDLKLLAICRKRDIRSLRDLDEQHLPLLKNILNKSTKVIKDKYKKNKGQLRAFIHYQPTFYHFHVHFEMVDASDYNASDRDNLLNDVINNITLINDYYKKATLTYPLPLDGELHQDLKKSKRRFNIPL